MTSTAPALEPAPLQPAHEPQPQPKPTANPPAQAPAPSQPPPQPQSQAQPPTQQQQPQSHQQQPQYQQQQPSQTQSQPRPTPLQPHPPPQSIPHPPTPSSQSVSTPNKRDLKSWWKGFKLPSKHQDTQVESRPQGIFGVPLRQSITYANVAISLIDENGKSYIYGYVPIVVAKCGVFLKEKATGVEGIFRLSGSEKRIKELKTIFDSPDRYGKGLVWDGYTVHDAANVLRRYLNDLPEPVVPLDLYEKFREPLRGATMQAVGDAEGPQFVDNFDLDAAIAQYQRLITELPPLNRQLLLYILDLLAVFAAKSDENRMNSQNLAAIFQPGMLSHPAHAMAPEEYRLNQCVIIFLIENQDHFLIGMQGTAADEKTVQEVQKGTPPTASPVTPNNATRRSSGVHRSSSNASAGAESVARDGKIRRNRSTSSRHSRHSNGGPSPGSPAALVPTTTGGLGRSNTLPSKKSPGIGSGRFHKKGEQPGVAPLTPATPSTPTPIPPSPTVEGAATPRERQRGLDLGSLPQASPALLAAGQHSGAGRSQEGLLEPTLPEALTPSRERKLQNLFQRSPTSESDPRQPNKLRKKRLASSANPSAQSSTTSLPHSASGVSPGVEVANPMERPLEVPNQAPTSSAMAPPAPSHLPPLVEGNLPSPGQTPAVDTPSEPTPRASQPSPGDTLAAASAEQTLKPMRSHPQSLHSSMNEGSDLDQFDESAPPAERSGEKEKKRRWRLSRRKDETATAAAVPIPDTPLPGPTSPRKVLGSNTNAEVSTSSVGSGGKAARRSFNGGEAGFADPSLVTTVNSAEAQSSHDSATSRDESRSLTGWIKNKYREAKENHDQRRNKSPPAGSEHGGAGAASLGTTSLLPSRGKSFDTNRPAAPAAVDEEKPRQ